MVGTHLRDHGSGNPDVSDEYVPRKEDMVQAKEGGDTRPGSPGAVTSREQELGVRQFPRKAVMDVGAGGRVHVAAKDHRWTAPGVAQPVGTEKSRRLCPAPHRRDPEVGIDDLDGVSLDVDLDPESTPAGFLAPRGESAGLHGPDGVSAEYGIAVAPSLNVEAGMEMEEHVQFTRDEVCLVHPARSAETHVKFLERHDIGIERRDDLGDPPGHILPIVADAAVHIVGHDGESHGRGHEVRIGQKTPGRKCDTSKDRGNSSTSGLPRFVVALFPVIVPAAPSPVRSEGWEQKRRR